MKQTTDYLSRMAARWGTPARFRRGDLIYGLEDLNDTLYLVEEGKVKLSYLDETGRKLALAILGKGRVFGELALARLPGRELLAEAIEDTRVYALDRDRLLARAQRDPRLLFELIILMGSRLQVVQRKIERLAFKDLMTRLADALLELTEEHGRAVKEGVRIDFRLTHQDLADLIGATRTNVTMMLGAFYDEGLLKKERYYITIVDRERLRQKALALRPDRDRDRDWN